MKNKSSKNTSIGGGGDTLIKKSKKRRTTNNSQSLEYFTELTAPIQIPIPDPPLPPPFVNIIDDYNEEIFNFKTSLSQLSLDHKLNLIDDVVLLNDQFELNIKTSGLEEEEEEEDKEMPIRKGNGDIMLANDLDFKLFNLKQESVDYENSLIYGIKGNVNKEEQQGEINSQKKSKKHKKLSEKLEKQMMRSMRRQVRQRERDEATKTKQKRVHRLAKATSLSNNEEVKLKHLDQISSNSSLNSNLDLFFDLNRFRKNRKTKALKTKTNTRNETLTFDNKNATYFDSNEIMDSNVNCEYNKMYFNKDPNENNCFDDKALDFEFEFDMENFQINFDAL